MMADGEVLGGLALAAIVVKECFTLVKMRINGNGKLKSGELPPEFWTAKFDRLADIGDAQVKLEERQTTILETLAADIAVLKDRTPRSWNEK